jgi:hypothetical protein
MVAIELVREDTACATSMAMCFSLGASRPMVARSITTWCCPLVDLGLGMLNPSFFSGVNNIAIEIRLRKAFESGQLDETQYITAHNFMSAGEFVEMRNYLNAILEKK